MKTALITGSSRGIGLAAAKQLETLGNRVIYHASKVSEKLIQAAGNQPYYGVDISDAQALAEWCDELLAKDMVPDILVLNASYQSYTGIKNFSDSEFRKMCETNLISTGMMLHKLLPAMKEKNWGRIIFVGSINGLKASEGLFLYGTTKAAFHNMARSIATDCAPFNITVNTILPGVIATDRNAAVLSNAETAEKLQNMIPMHRFGTAEECAELITFLASDAAGYITENEISIAGGLHL